MPLVLVVAPGVAVAPVEPGIVELGLAEPMPAMPVPPDPAIEPIPVAEVVLFGPFMEPMEPVEPIAPLLFPAAEPAPIPTDCEGLAFIAPAVDVLVDAPVPPEPPMDWAEAAVAATPNARAAALKIAVRMFIKASVLTKPTARTPR